MAPVSPYLIRKNRVIPALFAAFILYALVRAIFFLNVEQLLTATLGGAAGGFILGLMMTAGQYLGGDKEDYWTICWASTGVFALIGLIAGAIMII